MPVGQADGGRDALAFWGGSRVVFQVKFARNAHTDRSAARWFTQTAVEEIPKLRDLVTAGMNRYVLMTNVQGTAAHEVGSIDKVNTALQALGIHTECWWRDDIARRIDSHPQLRWAYPELLTAVDVLRGFFDAFTLEDRERRHSALSACLRDQYAVDRQVKFKQVELQNNLLELFIDVPVGPPSFPSKQQVDAHHAFEVVARQFPAENDQPYRVVASGEYWYREHSRISVGAATLFFHPLIQEAIPFVVLEGAPGQGKSTITQYVCQVHRMRLLNEAAVTDVPDYHRNVPLRIPFRVDLRDFATWLEKKDPFAPSDADVVPQQWQRSFESFLAAQVRHHSGGLHFDVTDLHAVARGSAMLLVCDGLDEIADIATRKEVIDEICRGVTRLQSSSASLQTIVTTRPVAFANAPAFSDERFAHFSLQSLPKGAIEQYADKWLRARNVPLKEKAVVTAILRDKLDQPHLRDLARNPMQLAILLSLILTRGASLPDKRTALYDQYIELFFNREAEKSPVVREYRDLLVDIHRYLAWVLHTGAEQGRSSGSVRDDQLRLLLRDYLKAEGRDPELADLLFAGLVERVVALVSRVQGTYEFEVQPLREYFAARYLYETAPYSPAGAEKRGTKPDRFAVISRNFYWSNVTRFYAGCYSKGELPSLVDGLRELAAADGFKYLGHPRVLTATLLTDWVFWQHQRSVQEAMRILTEGHAPRFLLSEQRYSPTPLLSLPEGCGRSEFAEFAFSTLSSFPKTDYAFAWSKVIANNTDPAERYDRWRDKVLSVTGSARTRWINYGNYLDVLENAPVSELAQILSDEPLTSPRIHSLLHSERSAFLQLDDARIRACIDVLLDSGGHFRCPERPATTLDIFVLAHALGSLPTAAYDGSDERRTALLPDAEHMTGALVCPPVVSSFSQSLSDFTAIALTELRRPTREWRVSLHPWDTIVETSRRRFGTRWTHYVLACASAGITASSETCTDASVLFDDSTSLCRRARYARLRSGQPTWWKEQLGNARSTEERSFAVLLALVWCKPATAFRIIPDQREWLELLENSWWRRLYSATRMVGAFMATRRRRKDERDLIPDELGPRACTLLSLTTINRARLYNRFLRFYDGDDTVVWDFCQRMAVSLAVAGHDNWENALAVVKRAYAHDVSHVSELAASRRHRRATLDRGTASLICSNPDAYPLDLLEAAQVTIKAAVGESIRPVARIANDDGWFEQLSQIR